MLSEETDCRIISLYNYGENASVMTHSQEEDSGQAHQSTHGVGWNVERRSGTRLLGRSSGDSWSRTLTTWLSNLADTEVFTLDLAAVLEGLEEVVALALKVTSRLEVERSLHVVEGWDVDPAWS